MSEVWRGSRRARVPGRGISNNTRIETTTKPAWDTATTVRPANRSARRSRVADTRRTKSDQLSPPGENGRLGEATRSNAPYVAR